MKHIFHFVHELSHLKQQPNTLGNGLIPFIAKNQMRRLIALSYQSVCVRSLRAFVGIAFFSEVQGLLSFVSNEEQASAAAGRHPRKRCSAQHLFFPSARKYQLFG